jgi:DNA helicase HerA-like ATPase
MTDPALPVGPAPLGRVIGTDDATPLEFWVAVAPGQVAQLDDVVALERVLPSGEVVHIYGIVGNVRARHEGARFDSDVFLIADGVLPAEVSEAAQVQPTRFEPEVFVPPLPGSLVRRAEGDDRAQALFYDQMVNRLPAGASRDGQPIFLNLDFIDGSRGAHVNISGISGVATKTSYATFLLYSMFTSGVLGAEAVNTKALVFNVKGEDLLFLDHPNNALDATNRDKYATLGLPVGAFPDLGVFAPPIPGDANAKPNVSSRTRNVRSFFWTIAEFCADSLLPFLFADAEDDRQQYTIVVHNVAAHLADPRNVQRRDDGSVTIDGKRIASFGDLVTVVEDHLDPDVADGFWAGRAIGQGTINAFIRRLHASVRHIDPLVRARPGNADPAANRVDFESHQVTVVDIHILNDRAKRFVVGVVLRQAFERKERSGSARPLQFVVLDELNKYAPRDGSSPIKEILLDIAERGRSLGIILVGAQQTASEVERRIVANSAIRVVGRLDSAEARRDEYGFLPPVQRQRSTILKPGSMFVTQPELPVPLLTEFPFPAWATRAAEAGAMPRAANEPDDPFEGLA